jgi:nucleotide-binding universal stress UspA family protein
MFHKHLVAVDRSQFSQPVFEAALEVAKTSYAKLWLLHVMALTEQGNPTLSISSGIGMAGAIDNDTMQIYEELWQSYAEKGLEMLQSFAAEADRAGVKAEIIQCGGCPEPEICDLARNWGLI